LRLEDNSSLACVQNRLTGTSLSLIEWMCDSQASETPPSSVRARHPPTCAAGRDAVKEFAAERIQGAEFWDIDGVCDPTTNLPHMLPSEEAFAAAADALGITNDDAVVVYDCMGMFAAPRAWWTWRVFGHDRWVPATKCSRRGVWGGGGGIG
jgi:3-mercaptopyruvate sulfurtransferase SseA